jgi:6-phospho-beta-glucosidase
VGLLAALHGRDTQGVHSVNVRNDGLLPFLPARAVIEVSARIGANGPAPLPVRPVAPDLAGLITAVWGYEELALDAALRGGRQRVYRALLAHPLIGQHEYADALADSLIAAGRRHLAWAR